MGEELILKKFDKVIFVGVPMSERDVVEKANKIKAGKAFANLVMEKIREEEKPCFILRKDDRNDYAKNMAEIMGESLTFSNTNENKNIVMIYPVDSLKDIVTGMGLELPKKTGPDFFIHHPYTGHVVTREGISVV